MYLFRSVQSEHLPNPRDLKARVLEHFRNPMPVPVQKVQDLLDLCESNFERDVFKRLVQQSYRVIPQVAVGEFRIDLVVEGEQDRRLAIELDGDRYHGPDRWFEDWNRQKILERVGWRFWRCWASSFALDPEDCMDDLIATLESMQIYPIGANHSHHPYTAHRTVDTTITRAPTTALEESEPVVGVGDQVVISFVEAPERYYVLTLAATQHDPLNGIVSMNDPTGHTLLNASVEDEIVLPWNGETRTAIVLQIKKQTADGTP